MGTVRAMKSYALMPPSIEITVHWGFSSHRGAQVLVCAYSSMQWSPAVGVSVSRVT